MNNLIDIKQLSNKRFKEIFALAKKINRNSKKKNAKVLRGKAIANLFFENSTRTLVSFELAAKKLGAHVVNVNLSKSSTTKGESIKDTILTLQSMGIDIFIIRHSQNFICQEIKKWLNPKTVLINAGDGNNQHPTQALLDIYTILKYKKELNKLKIAIIGDIKHSRVASSLIDGLHILGNHNITIYGPKILMPDYSKKALIVHSMKEALDNVDVIVMLRIQKERIEQQIPNLTNYHQQFGLNRNTLSYANHGCIVMHPGPINRGVEISAEIADNSPSVILDQVKNGVLIRQALLYYLLKNYKN